MTGKPWMCPIQYNDARSAETLRAEVPLESDHDEHGVPREDVRARESVKPAAAWRENTYRSTDIAPMNYRKHDQGGNSFGLDDNDELDGVEDEHPAPEIY